MQKCLDKHLQHSSVRDVMLLARKCSRIIFRERVFLCEDRGQLIDPFEAVYSAKKGSSQLIDHEGHPLSWFEAARRLSSSWAEYWIMFSVYYDLRERGRVLAHGPLRNGFTLYVGGKPKFIVIVVEETVPFHARKLIELNDVSRKMGREPILAIVDKHGDVSYYTLERFG